MQPCGAGIQYVKGKVLSAFSASISTAHLLLDICMYQHDLGRRRTANIAEQQEKRRRLYSKAGRQIAFTKGAEFYARLLSPMKNCGDEEKFLLTVERLTLQEFLRKARIS